jgi:uncharacterized surface protein with fasciclin (FAS1) repeats
VPSVTRRRDLCSRILTGSALSQGTIMSANLNLIDTIASDSKFSAFSRMMASSGANEVFDGEGPFTVFVPTNDAFGKIPDELMLELLNQAGQLSLKALLTYHIVRGKVMAANVASKLTRESMTGEEISFADKNGLKVNKSSLQSRNIEASNGVVHALDTVLERPIGPGSK